METTGKVTCSKDYESMHAPVVELLTKEDLALAVQYLNPALTEMGMKNLYEQGKVKPDVG